MGFWGSTATAHWAACYPNKSARCPAWKVFVIIMQHCQEHLSGVQKDKSPIRIWQLCAVFWQELITEFMHWFTFWLRLKCQRISHWWSLYMNNLESGKENRIHAAVIFCLFAALINCFCVWWRSGWSTGVPNKDLGCRKVISDISIFASFRGLCPHNCSAMHYVISQ